MASALASYERDAEAAAAALQDVSYLLVERDNARRAGGTGAADLSGRLRGATVKMDRLVDGLERQLKLIEADVAAYGLTKREALSKRDALRKMTNERLRLRGLERTSVAAAASSAGAVSDKDALLASASRGGGGGGGAGGGSAAPPQASPEELQMRTQMELRNQDEQLDSLSKGLVGLKQMGLAISEETALQMKLIDEIEEGTDRGDAALKRETARAEHITQDTRTCWLYVAICILLAILIGLVVVSFGHVTGH